MGSRLGSILCCSRCSSPQTRILTDPQLELYMGKILTNKIKKKLLKHCDKIRVIRVHIFIPHEYESYPIRLNVVVWKDNTINNLYYG